MEFVSNLNPDEPIIEEFYHFLLNQYWDEIVMLLTEPDPLIHYSLNVSYSKMLQYTPEIAWKLLEREPGLVLKKLDDAALKAVDQIYIMNLTTDVLIRKTFIHIRIKNFFKHPKSLLTQFPSSYEAGRFISLAGVVTKVEQSGVLEFRKLYRCGNCNEVFGVEIHYNSMQFPVRPCPSGCPNKPKEIKPNDQRELAVSSEKRYKDYQKVTIQELNSIGKLHAQPKVVVLILLDNLINCIYPGQEITVTGELIWQHKPFRKEKEIVAELIMLVNQFNIKEDRHFPDIDDEIRQKFVNFWNSNNKYEGLNKIVQLFCPKVFQLFIPKKAILLSLLGGADPPDDHRKDLRSSSHLLIVGDPGISKSTLLTYCKNVSQNVHYTNGAGATCAGMTASAIRVDSEWSVSPGVFVLADKGVLCIDEFNRLGKDVLTSLHGGMEQQTISVAKAGMVMELKAKTTVIAACNPGKYSWDSTRNLEENTGLETPLLSRFDLIIVLRDVRSADWDEALADFRCKIKYFCTTFSANL